MPGACAAPGPVGVHSLLLYSSLPLNVLFPSFPVCDLLLYSAKTFNSGANLLIVSPSFDPLASYAYRSLLPYQFEAVHVLPRFNDTPAVNQRVRSTVLPSGSTTTVSTDRFDSLWWQVNKLGEEHSARRKNGCVCVFVCVRAKQRTTGPEAWLLRSAHSFFVSLVRSFRVRQSCRLA